MRWCGACTYINLETLGSMLNDSSRHGRSETFGRDAVPCRSTPCRASSPNMGGRGWVPREHLCSSRVPTCAELTLSLTLQRHLSFLHMHVHSLPDDPHLLSTSIIAVNSKRGIISIVVLQGETADLITRRNVHLKRRYTVVATILQRCYCCATAATVLPLPKPRTQLAPPPPPPPMLPASSSSACRGALALRIVASLRRVRVQPCAIFQDRQ